MSGASAIAAGYDHSLAVKDGRVWAWGTNDFGQTNVPVAAQSGVTKVSAGSSFSMALKSSGDIVVWGSPVLSSNIPANAVIGVSGISADLWNALALGQLSAGLAHEVRNPLASIEGAAAILLREPPSEERRVEFLEIIQKESRRLNRLLSTFLDFAKPRAPEFQMAKVERVIDSVLALTEHSFLRAAIAVRREVATDLPPFEHDPEQITQILLNLTINAIQAMPNGGEIAISAFREGDSAVIEVSDQGCGISEEDMERIYDPFFTTKETGTGLGLPVAHQIALNQGGILAARRNTGNGMTFSLRLPLRAGAAE